MMMMVMELDGIFHAHMIVQMIAGVRQQLVCVTGVIHVDLYIWVSGQ